jgi:hypothetical protein
LSGLVALSAPFVGGSDIIRRGPCGFLSGQNEATGTRARELHQPRRDMLPPLWIH